MDQIFFNLNPALKQFIENTIRQSNQLQKESEKSSKSEKGKHAKGVDSFDHVQAGNVLGEELLGHLGSTLSYMGSSGRYTKSEQEEEQSEAQESSVPRPEASAKEEADRVEIGSEKKEGERKKHSQGDESSSDEEEGEAGSPEGSDILLEGEGSSGALSLDLPDTFGNAQEETSLSEETLEDQVHKFLLNNLIIAGDENLKGKLAAILSIAGSKLLSRCTAFGVRIFLIPKGMDLRQLGVRDCPDSLKDLRAGYLPSLRTCIIGEEIVEGWSSARYNLPMYLLAHAFDHAMGQDSFASLKSPAVLSSFHACKQRKEGHQFLDGYASIGPVQYFASVVAAYFSGSANGAPWAASRNDLYDLDRSVYLYLDYLFRKNDETHSLPARQ